MFRRILLQEDNKNRIKGAHHSVCRLHSEAAFDFITFQGFSSTFFFSMTPNDMLPIDTSLLSVSRFHFKLQRQCKNAQTEECSTSTQLLYRFSMVQTFYPIKFDQINDVKKETNISI